MVQTFMDDKTDLCGAHLMTIVKVVCILLSIIVTTHMYAAALVQKHIERSSRSATATPYTFVSKCLVSKGWPGSE